MICNIITTTMVTATMSWENLTMTKTALDHGISNNEEKGMVFTAIYIAKHKENNDQQPRSDEREE